MSCWVVNVIHPSHRRLITPYMAPSTTNILPNKTLLNFFSSFSAASIQAGSANVRRTCSRNLEQVRRTWKNSSQKWKISSRFGECSSTNVLEKTRAGSPNRRTCSRFLTKIPQIENMVQSSRFAECSSTNLLEIFRAGSANIRLKNSSRFAEPVQKKLEQVRRTFGSANLLDLTLLQPYCC